MASPAPAVCGALLAPSGWGPVRCLDGALSSGRPSADSAYLSEDCALLAQPWYSLIMSKLTVTSLVYKEEGDTSVRCGPVFKRMSDGSLENFRDTGVEPRFREDGKPFAAWFRLAQARRFAREARLKLEVM